MLTRLLHPFTPPTRDKFIRIVRGEGARVWDDAGNEYLDGMSALWFANLGYGRQEIVDAIAAQAAKLHAYHCFDPFSNEPAEQLAERIAALAPVDDGRVLFTTSGSDAVDAAVKIARAAKLLAGEVERTLVVSRIGGYHGTNLGGTSAGGIALNREGWGPLLGDHLLVDRDDVDALERLFAARGHEIAAVIVEPVQGAGGVHPAPPGYLAAVRRLCSAHGAFMAVDEVICGFGRLGRWFGSEVDDVRADVLVFAKAITSGYQPLGGVVVGAAVREPLESDPAYWLRTGQTYSGHATACAAGLACLDLTEKEGLLERASRLGDRLSDGLADLVKRGLYRGFRGEGFVWALEMREDQDPTALRFMLLERGVILRPFPGCLAICPPLVVTESQVDQIVTALADVAAMQ